MSTGYRLSESIMQAEGLVPDHTQPSGYRVVPWRKQYLMDEARRLEAKADKLREEAEQMRQLASRT